MASKRARGEISLVPDRGAGNVLGDINTDAANIDGALNHARDVPDTAAGTLTGSNPTTLLELESIPTISFNAL
jgi:hypothetical protein